MMIKAILFDFDGTLTELTLDFGQAKEDMFNIGDKYLAGGSARDCEEPFILDTIYAIEARCGEAAPAFRKEALDRLTEIELETSKGKDLFPFTRGLLKELRGKGIKVAILTRSCRKSLLRVFPDMTDYVDAVVTREDVKYTKPHPSHVEKTLSVLGVERDEVMIVGDQKTDIMAGRVLGIRTVGVLTGRPEKCGFDEVEPTHIIQDVRGILDLL
jgi:phosphoglycolate phosphatase